MGFHCATLLLYANITDSIQLIWNLVIYMKKIEVLKTPIANLYPIFNTIQSISNQTCFPSRRAEIECVCVPLCVCVLHMCGCCSEDWLIWTLGPGLLSFCRPMRRHLAVKRTGPSHNRFPGQPIGRGVVKKAQKIAKKGFDFCRGIKMWEKKEVRSSIKPIVFVHIQARSSLSLKITFQRLLLFVARFSQKSIKCDF